MEFQRLSHRGRHTVGSPLIHGQAVKTPGQVTCAQGQPFPRPSAFEARTCKDPRTALSEEESGRQPGPLPAPGSAVLSLTDLSHFI